MADVVRVTYAELQALQKELADVRDELEHAYTRGVALRDAVGHPYGEMLLHDAVDDFESRWDDRRVQLMDRCSELETRLTRVVTSIKDWDVRTNAASPAAASPAAASPAAASPSAGVRKAVR
ncbi:hypothetical protein [Microbacterium sp. 2MCAF23]|uniref:hypothetical protein n=1 Tax=Microbacterium sp. 2MCAF23 TaxID=3232985 RepID=UPI003F9BF9C1